MTSSDNGKAPNLQPQHLEDLRKSGLSDGTIKENRFASITEEKHALDILKWNGNVGKLLPALGIPFLDREGKKPDFARLKPDNPRSKKENGETKTVKYEQPKGQPVRPYFPRNTWPLLDDPAQPILIVEGEKKACKAVQEGFACIGVTGVECWSAPRPKGADGRKVGPRELHQDIAALPLHGRRVYIAFDSDLAQKADVQRAEQSLAAALKKAGADVRCIRLPPASDGGKVGLDDFLCTHSTADLRALMDSAEEPEEDVAIFTEADDPHFLAKRFIVNVDNLPMCPTPRLWHGEYYDWGGDCYHRVSKDEIQGRLVCCIKDALDADYRVLARSARIAGEKKGTVKKVTRGVVADTMQALDSMVMLPDATESPSWIGGTPLFPADELLVAPNALVHLKSLVENNPDAVMPPMPTFFATATLGCDFDRDAAEPKTWFEFLGKLWPDDQESIDTLQEWFGYCLTSNTSLHKILFVVGPPRSGKGTIVRQLRALLGPEATAAPTLTSLCGPFGLQPLLGKSLATITDARLSHRHNDIGQITERLLAISGEDGQTVARKGIDSVHLPRLPVRFMILSNELPALADASGVIVSRLIVLRQTRSWLGNEDTELDNKLKPELPGILLWAIDGWDRLRKRKKFQQPKSGQPIIQQLHELASPVNAFVAECCEPPDAKHTERTATLFAAWQGWAQARGMKPGSDGIFGRNLRAVIPGIDSSQARDGDSKGGKDNRFRQYKGVRLNDWGRQYAAGNAAASSCDAAAPSRDTESEEDPA